MTSNLNVKKFFNKKLERFKKKLIYKSKNNLKKNKNTQINFRNNSRSLMKIIFLKHHINKLWKPG